MNLQNRSAVITGANQGLGEAIAKAFVAAGANVYLCARNLDLLNQVRDKLAKGATAEQKVLAEACDVSKPEQVDRLVANALAALGKIDILVNNAGVYGPKGESESVDWEAWQQALEINLYGTVLPTRALLPHFKTAGYGKIINISGGGATNPLPRFSAYAASKAAVVRFSETIAEEVRPFHIDVNAVAPGALNTRLLDEVLDSGPDVVGENFYKRALEQKEQGGAPLERGADLCVFLASVASDGITGKLISAIWDPWEKLPEHQQQLQSDIYTLRRIIPKDRGQDWGER
ncbi:MAG: SDR family oxidoreductase [Anaerolineae bacterium]|nr:SDR family oxidoreductase [Anaerolineae bacterium]